MATVNEQIVTGRKFRKLVDEATKLWQRISFWTKAIDVEFNDNKTAEIKLGAIDGITDSLVSTSSRIAASAKAVNTLNNNLGGYSFGETADGKPGYRKPGADTVIPFSNVINGTSTTTSNISKTLVFNTGQTGHTKYLFSCNATILDKIEGANSVYGFSISYSYNANNGIVTVTIKDPMNVLNGFDRGTHYLNYVFFS